jgi:tryptophan-rich sensory protein
LNVVQLGTGVSAIIIFAGRNQSNNVVVMCLLTACMPLNPLWGTIMVGINQRGWSLVCICTQRADRMQARLPIFK